MKVLSGINSDLLLDSNVCSIEADHKLLYYLSKRYQTILIPDSQIKDILYHGSAYKDFNGYERVIIGWKHG